MGGTRRRTTLGAVVFFLGAFALGLYFTFAAVQGNFGLFQRIQIEAEAQALELKLADLRAEVAAMENKTRRMSDDFLDLDLLDEQSRAVLGLVRPDELLIR